MECTEGRGFGLLVMKADDRPEERRTERNAGKDVRRPSDDAEAGRLLFRSS